MTILGIELNDAAISAVDGQSAPVSAPGYAVVKDGDILVGFDAWKSARLHPKQTTNRFWRDLSDQPLPRLMHGGVSAADLVHTQLQDLCAGFAPRVEGAVFAVPAHWSPDQLGLLLGIAEDLAIPVNGLVDSAVAATRREYRGSDLLNLDASLHELTISRMLQAGKTSVGERRAVDLVGIEGLERVCAEFIARRFVEGTRFDPLHDGKSEQYLYDQMHFWLDDLNRETVLALTVEFGGNEFATTLNRSELAERVIEYIEPVIQQVRSLLSVGVPAAVQVSDRLAVFPGFVEAMARLSRATVFILEPAAAALGALHRAGSLASTEGGIRLTTALPWDQPAVDLDSTGGDAASAATGIDERPTHVIFSGHAYRLENQPFNIGSELSPGEYGIALDRGKSGVSRRHCTIRVGVHGVEVVDYSRHGTRLNGHAIDGAAILQSGDVLSLGNPASEFLMITEVTAETSSRAKPDGA